MDCGRDNKVFRCLNAIHLLLFGVGYDLVLRNRRVSGRMLRLWISRFNAQGIDGLTYKPRPGRPRKLDAAKVVSDILPPVDDPALANQTHWPVIKLCGWRCKEKGEFKRPAQSVAAGGKCHREFDRQGFSPGAC